MDKTYRVNHFELDKKAVSKYLKFITKDYWDNVDEAYTPLQIVV